MTESRDGAYLSCILNSIATVGGTLNKFKVHVTSWSGDSDLVRSVLSAETNALLEREKSSLGDKWDTMKTLRGRAVEVTFNGEIYPDSIGHKLIYKIPGIKSPIRPTITDEDIGRTYYSRWFFRYYSIHLKSKIFIQEFPNKNL